MLHDNRPRENKKCLNCNKPEFSHKAKNQNCPLGMKTRIGYTSFYPDKTFLAKAKKPITKALIVVDIQKDFCQGGSLAVPDGDSIVPLVNSLMKDFKLVIATQDFHPKNHKSFASNNQGKKVGELGELNGQVQVMWPDHCVQGTDGVMFHNKLERDLIPVIVQKGTNPEVDSYSGFFDNDKKSSTGLGEFLKKEGVKEVVVVGLALDYCVKATALDAKKLGFDTTVILEATKAVNLSPNDGEKAIFELKQAGVKVI